MAKKHVIKFAANFERNIEEIECFLTDVEAPQAYDGLLDELLETVIPNLERFPDLGKPFMLRMPRSVETINALAALRAYVLKDSLLLYVPISSGIYLLTIRHQRQLSFDFEGHWD